jgi:hypothetical protein
VQCERWIDLKKGWFPSSLGVPQNQNSNFFFLPQYVYPTWFLKCNAWRLSYSISHFLGCKFIWILLLDFQNISDTLEISLGTLVLFSIMTFVCNFLLHNHIKDWEEDSNLWHNLLHKIQCISLALHIIANTQIQKLAWIMQDLLDTQISKHLKNLIQTKSL